MHLVVISQVESFVDNIVIVAPGTYPASAPTTSQCHILTILLQLELSLHMLKFVKHIECAVRQCYYLSRVIDFTKHMSVITSLHVHINRQFGVVQVQLIEHGELGVSCVAVNTDFGMWPRVVVRLGETSWANLAVVPFQSDHPVM